MIYFITANKKKVREAKKIIPEIRQYSADLPEIQEIDAKKIIRAKLEEALKHKKGEFVVEDTSLYLDCMKGLPGPLIKWFLHTVGNEGIAEIAEKFNNNKATAKCIIGYAGKNKIKFFEGSVSGGIVKPKGRKRFGWDPIFRPNGCKMTFAEMGVKEKNKISMRKKAFEKLKRYLK